MPTLSWLTREQDLKAAANAEYRLLVEEEQYSYGDTDAGNIIVQGDNLEALKALLPFYAGQVKYIYIDPPYNTGSAFEHYSCQIVTRITHVGLAFNNIIFKQTLFDIKV
jgi:adenine-specific DNA-methyltransferase